MTDSNELEIELRVLRAIVGVDLVGEYPKGRWDKNRNKNRVRCRVQKDGEVVGQPDVHCSAEISTKLLAAREVKRLVGNLLGPAAVQAAEEQIHRELSGSSGAASCFMERSREAQAKLHRRKQIGEEIQLARAAVTEAARVELAAAQAQEAAAQSLTTLQAEREELFAEPAEKRQRPAEGATAGTAANHAVEADLDAPPLHHSGTNPPNWHRYWNYPRSTYEGEETKEQKRRAVEIDPKQTPREMPPGDDARGWHNHWRRGVFGALRSWAKGSLGSVVYMLAACAVHFECVEQLGEALNLTLGKERVRQAETDAYIVDRARDVLSVLKDCRSEQQRIEYHIVLAALAPEIAQAGPQGYGTRVAERLNVSIGWRTRTAKEKAAGAEHGRPRALRRAMEVRASFQERAAATCTPLQPGDAVLARGQLGELTGFHEGGGCTVTFEAEGVEGSKTYVSSYGKGKGSARLQRPPASLQPAPRSARSDALTAAAVKTIQDFWRQKCAVSPHQRDARKRRVAPHVYEHAQGIIQLETDPHIEAEFQAAHPGVCKRFEFLRHKPWYVIHAYRETCLCKTCENLRLYMVALKMVADVLQKLDAPSLEADESEEGVGATAANEEGATATEGPAVEEEALPPIAKELAKFCSLELKEHVANKLVAPCADRLDKAPRECINGQCKNGKCGFQRFWSGKGGLRCEFIDEKGDVKPSTPPELQATYQWERITSASSTPSDGSRGVDEDAMREQREGTLIELLDEFERVAQKVLPHRDLIVEAKKAARELYENATPGMLLNDSDWAENGKLEQLREFQSEYWVQVSYCLFMSITSFLETAAWVERESVLLVGAEVTVEPEGQSVEGSISPPLGSFYATIATSPGAAGKLAAYSVKRPDGTCTSVPRERLRHRKWYTTAFIGVTNERRHDGATTQAMFNRQLGYWSRRSSKKENTTDANLKASAASATAAATTKASAAADRVAAAEAALAAAEAALQEDEEYCGRIKEVEAAREAARAAAASAQTANGPTPRIYDEAAFARWRQQFSMEDFWAWAGHSDNATHFKSAKQFHYWSQRSSEVAFLKMLWIEFGCPGHGKGPWDGLGAVMKTKVRTDLKNGGEAVKTKSGKIRSAREVAEHLHARFGGVEWEAAHAEGKINQIIVFYVDETEIAERPAVEPTYNGVEGSTRMFSYMGLGPEKMAARERSCWCPACSRARGPGEGMVWEGKQLKVPGCTRPERAWTAHEVKRTDAAGVANKKKQAQAEGHRMAAKLGIGMWIGVQARERWSTTEDVHFRPGHYWLARTVDAGDGTCIIKRVDKRRETINGNLFTNGDYAIAVEWFDRSAEDSSGLSFVAWAPPDVPEGPLVINSSELREIALDVRMQAPVIKGPPLKSVKRKKQKGGKKKKGAGLVLVPPTKDPAGTLYEVKPEDDNRVRIRCVGY